MLNETVLVTSLLSGIDSLPMEGLGSSLAALLTLVSILFGGVVCFFADDLETLDPTTEDFFGFCLIFESKPSDFYF